MPYIKPLPKSEIQDDRTCNHCGYKINDKEGSLNYGCNHDDYPNNCKICKGVFEAENNTKIEVFQQESIEECLQHPDYFDYLRDEDFKDDLTSTEIIISHWLEIEGYWAFKTLENGRMSICFPKEQFKLILKTQALKIMRERYGEQPRLYWYEEIQAKKREKEAKHKAYKLQKIEEERFCQHCGIITERCDCEKGKKERDVYE